MDLGALIETHGYWVLALGCLLEGETVLLLAGVAAYRGYLELPWVIGIAAVAGFAGDQFYFWLGRHHAARVMARWPWVAGQARRVQGLIERHHAWLIVGVRFAYGLRIAGPILLGTAPIPALRFALFNAIGALLWAALIGGLGWLAGTAVQRLLGEVHRIEAWLFVAFAALALGVRFARAWRRRRDRP
jgi:membrane protein DedA with SNARE-associated domain